jgi:hypothetical protein
MHEVVEGGVPLQSSCSMNDELLILCAPSTIDIITNLNRAHQLDILLTIKDEFDFLAAEQLWIRLVFLWVWKIMIEDYKLNEITE